MIINVEAHPELLTDDELERLIDRARTSGESEYARHRPAYQEACDRVLLALIDEWFARNERHGR